MFKDLLSFVKSYQSGFKAYSLIPRTENEVYIISHLRGTDSISKIILFFITQQNVFSICFSYPVFILKPKMMGARKMM